jgi:hypothetical protein
MLQCFMQGAFVGENEPSVRINPFAEADKILLKRKPSAIIKSQMKFSRFRWICQQRLKRQAISLHMRWNNSHHFHRQRFADNAFVAVPWESEFGEQFNLD